MDWLTKSKTNWMRKHTKIYLSHFNYFGNEFIGCEMCGKRAVDIHHIECRGMGGSAKDDINNIMAMCRNCHITYGDKKQYKELLKQRHEQRLENFNKA
jgi:ribosome-binding protein aMBF1 (putative translation factor)